MTRTLISTDTPGWFVDPANPDKKVRKQDGDTIVAPENHETPAAATAVQEQQEDIERHNAMIDAETKRQERHEQDVKVRDDAIAKGKELVTLSTGKKMKTKTVEIRCAWVDEDKRTPAQKQLFSGPKSAITYDAVKDAAGGTKAALPTGEKRTIAAQDQFQVRFSPENQEKWRREQRRRNYKSKKKA